MNCKSPTKLLARRAQSSTVIGEQGLVIAAPRLGGAGGDAAEPLGFDELNSTSVRKAFFCRIYQLHYMAARAICRQLADDLTKVADWTPEVGDQQHFRKWRRRKI